VKLENEASGENKKPQNDFQTFLTIIKAFVKNSPHLKATVWKAFLLMNRPKKRKNKRTEHHLRKGLARMILERRQRNQKTM
jgi:hypothetical protein